MAARVPSAGIHLVFFGFTITQLLPVGALHAIDLRASFDRRNQEDDIMNCRSLLTMTPIGIIGLCAINTAKADEVLKFRLVMHATYVQSQEVGDVDGHVLGLGRFSGLALFSDGSVGTADLTATNDYIKGAGTYLVYFHVALRDGSALWYKLTGPARPEGATTVFLESPISVLRGTGRFEGAKGDGTSSGVRLTPLGADAELYTDVVINVKK